MRIIDVSNDEDFIQCVAVVLLDGFTTSGINPWESLDSAIEEVRDSLAEGRISRAAIDENENVLGGSAVFMNTLSSGNFTRSSCAATCRIKASERRSSKIWNNR